MAYEEVAQVPRKGREIVWWVVTLQTVVGSLLTTLLLHEVTGSVLWPLLVGGLVAVLTWPVRGVEIGVRVFWIVRYLVYGRRTIQLGAAHDDQPRGPRIRVIKREKGWRFRS